MTTPRIDNREQWLAYRVAECERLITSTLTRETELDLMQLASKESYCTLKAANIEIHTDNARLARLLANVHG